MKIIVLLFCSLIHLSYVSGASQLNPSEAITEDVQAGVVYNKLDPNKNDLEFCESGSFLDGENRLCFDFEIDYSEEDKSLFISKVRMKTELLKSSYILDIKEFSFQFLDQNNKKVYTENLFDKFEQGIDTNINLGYLAHQGYALGQFNDASDQFYLNLNLKLSWEKIDDVREPTLTVEERRLKVIQDPKIKKIFPEMMQFKRDRICALKSGLVYCWGGDEVTVKKYIENPKLKRIMGIKDTEHEVIENYNYRYSARAWDRGSCWSVKFLESGSIGNICGDSDKYAKESEKIERQISRDVFVPEVVLGSKEDPVLDIVFNQDIYEPFDEGMYEYTACAVFSGARLKCWGEKKNKTIGLSYRQNAPVISLAVRAEQPFVKLGTLDEEIVSLQAIKKTFCALMSSKRFLCWGDNDHGELGVESDPDPFDRVEEKHFDMSSARYVDTNKVKARQVYSAKGNTHVFCSTLENNQIICWGLNNFGALGVPGGYSFWGEVGKKGLLAQVDFGKLDLVGSEFQVGTSSRCLLLLTKKMKCWGFPSITGHQELTKDGPYEYLRDPNLFVPFEEDVKEFYGLHDGRGYALLKNNELWTWGSSSYDNLQSLFKIPIVGKKIRSLHFPIQTADRACVSFYDSSFKCWGSNYYGQAGASEKSYSIDLINSKRIEDLEYVLLSDFKISKFYLFDSVNCILFVNGKVKCWGDNRYGLAGQNNGDLKIGDMPGDLESLDYIHLSDDLKVMDLHSFASTHICAEFEDHSLKCWGKLFRDQKEKEAAGGRTFGNGDMKGIQFIRFE